MQFAKRGREHLDELILLQLRDRGPVRGQRHIDFDVHEVEVRVAEPGVWATGNWWGRELAKPPFLGCKEEGIWVSMRIPSKKRETREEELTIKHNNPNPGVLPHGAHVPGLLLQFADCARARALTGIDQSGRDLDDDFTDWGPELFL